jgi:hypothetical protein
MGPCRTYATSYSELISVATGSGWQQSTVTHTATFNRTSLTLTDTASDGTIVVETFATLADFIEMADPSVLLKGRGPTSVRKGSATVTNSFDAAGKATGYVTSVSSVTAVLGAYTSWDTYGRPTRGTRDVIQSQSEKCIGQAVQLDRYEDARTFTRYFSGGTNQTATAASNCRAARLITHYDSRLILRKASYEPSGGQTVQSEYTTLATSTVCM